MRIGHRVLWGAILCAVLGAAISPASSIARTINVTTTADGFSTAGGGDGLCSLREAVYAVNVNGSAVATGCATGEAIDLDTIRLAPGATYQLVGDVPTSVQEVNFLVGDLEIAASGPVRIETPAAGPRATIDAGDRDRALEVLTSADLTLADLRVMNGTAALGRAGGGIRADDGDLRLDRVEVSGNVAASNGGGISVGAGGSLDVEDSTVSGNGISATGQNVNALGGGIHSEGQAEIARTDFNDNDISAQDGFTIGGGLYNSTSGTAIVRDSVLRGHALAGNTFGQFGGGIGNDGELSVLNSTVVANQVGNSDLTSQGGAGIYSTALGNAEIRQTTIHGNQAFMPGGGDALRGDNFEVAGSLIGVGNSDIVCAVSSGLVSGDNNVMFGDTCALNASNDLHLQDVPAISGLADNGGPTPTSAIPADSPAINHVPAAECLDLSGNALTADQRGAVRPFGSACDAGAYELTTCGGTVVNSDPALGAGCPVASGSWTQIPSVPPFIALDPPPFTGSKKCKKGQKLKKGRCVKKRKKKK